jgi:hypothetical protein
MENIIIKTENNDKYGMCIVSVKKNNNHNLLKNDINLRLKLVEDEILTILKNNNNLTNQQIKKTISRRKKINGIDQVIKREVNSTLYNLEKNKKISMIERNNQKYWNILDIDKSLVVDNKLIIEEKEEIEEIETNDKIYFKIRDDNNINQYITF